MRLAVPLSLRSKLVLTFLGAVVLALALAFISAAMLITVVRHSGGSEYLEALARQPDMRERANAVADVLAGGGGMEAVQHSARPEAVPPGGRVQVVDMEGRVWVDSAGGAGRIATVSEVMRWLNLEQDSPPSLVFVEPIIVPRQGGLGWGYYVYTQALTAPQILRIGTGSPGNRIAGLVMVGGQGLALLVSLLLFWFFGRHLVRPLARFSAVVGRIASGDLTVRTGLSARKDELGQLARDVDRMAGSLEEAQSRAAAAEGARRFMVAAVSHDIRTPLTGLLAHAEALRSGIAEDAEQSLAIIAEKGLLIKELLEDLFELAALDADRSRWQLVRTDVAELVRSAVAAMLPELEQAGLTLAAEIPESPVWADLPRGKLERVLDNLLSNARKYGEAGGWLGVLVALNGGVTRIEVADRGPGVPPAEALRVFDRYYRGGTAASGRVQGSGLGLAVAREIVERLGGRIGVESPPEGGARFWVELPGAEK